MKKRGKKKRDKVFDKKDKKVKKIKKEGKKNKKGISKIIVAIILIVIVLIAVGIIWAVISNLISKQTEGVSLEKFTIDAEIKGIGINETTNSISVLVRRKPGAGNLVGFKFVFNNGTDNEVHTVNTIMDELEERVFTFILSMNVSNVLTISLIPLIKSGDKEIQGNIIDVYNVKTRKGIEIPSNGENGNGNVSNGNGNITLGYECSSCGDCNNAIANAISGEIIYLNASLNNVVGTCIDFNGKANIIFDCQGNTIDGDDSGVDYGIYLSTGSDSNTIRNCNIPDFRNGIYIYYSDNNTITSIIANSNIEAGIRIGLYSNDNIITNSTFNNNSYGIEIGPSIGNIIQNIITQENNYLDIAISALSDSDCNNNFTNITGSGNRPIEYYNYAATVEDKILSQLILCNADNIVINNVAIIGSNTLNNNRLRISRTDNAVISNVNSFGNNYGLYVDYSNNNNLMNIITNSNSLNGLFLVASNNNTLTNVLISDSQIGIKLDISSDNILQNITTKSNQYGIALHRNSDYNILHDSHIENNSEQGIRFTYSSSALPEYNLIYNNFFNNTDNYYNNTALTNYFNTTKTLGTNIVGGSYIGGNYWAHPDGTGFSETCIDSDTDDICDSPYDIEGYGDYDYLPLS